MTMGLLRSLALASLAASAAFADGLHARAAALGKYMGIEYSLGDLSDPRFARIVNNRSDFGFHTPSGVMQWDVTEPQRDQFVFGPSDRAVAAAQAAGMKLHCGPLVWHGQLPGWAARLDNATALAAAVRNHVAAVVAHHRGACARWDVVAEALAEDGGLRDSALARTLGAAFVPLAFAAAAAADPDAALFYADYNLERPAKAAGARRLVDLVRAAAGARVDGVALQAHLAAGMVPASAAALREQTLRPFADLGLDVAYAPLDIQAGAGGAAQQAADYATVVAACAGLPRCLGVSLGRLADLFLGNYQKKPAYTAILDAWGPAPAT